MVTEDTYITVLSGEQHCNVKISQVIDMFIEQPEVHVVSHDGKKVSNSVVSNTRATDSKDFISIQFEDAKSLVLTQEHQVYVVEDKQWKRAHQLHTGQHVLSSDNKSKKITSTHIVRDLISHKIYALAVTPDQCYYANDVLIHNES